jgi:hypothetical protein
MLNKFLTVETKMKKVVFFFIIVSVLLVSCSDKDVISLSGNVKDKFNFSIGNESEAGETVLNGDDIIEVKIFQIKIVPTMLVGFGNAVYFVFHFTEDGRMKLSEVTKNFDKIIYVYFDNILISTAIIREEINSGELRLSGLSWEEMEYLIEYDAFSSKDLNLINDWVIEYWKNSININRKRMSYK